MSEVKEKDLTPAIFDLEVKGVEYALELNNEAVRKADDMGMIAKIQQGSGTADILQNLILVFGMKNHGMTPSLAKKIVDSIINDKEYDPSELAAMLIEELIVRYQQVFTLEGAKKTLTRR